MLKTMNGCGYCWDHPVTPYIHILAKHVPDILRKYRTLRIFSGQGKYFHFKYFVSKVTKHYVKGLF